MSSTSVKHIVFWKLSDFAEGNDKATNALKVKALLDSCSEVVPGILKFEAVIAQPGLESSVDVALYSEFASLEALDAYQKHPQHEAIKPFIGAVRSGRECIDYISG